MSYFFHLTLYRKDFSVLSYSVILQGPAEWPKVSHKRKTMAGWHWAQQMPGLRA